MIKITELISKLEDIKTRHGDIVCVVSGFDEHDYSSLDIVRVVNVLLNTRPVGHCGGHSPSQDGDEGSVKAVFIDF